MVKPSPSSKQDSKPQVIMQGNATAIFAHNYEGGDFPLATKGGEYNPSDYFGRKDTKPAMATDTQMDGSVKDSIPIIICTGLVKKLNGTTKASILVLDEVTYFSRNVLESTPDILEAFREAKINPPRVRRSVPLYLAEKLGLRLH